MRDGTTDEGDTVEKLTKAAESIVAQAWDRSVIRSDDYLDRIDAVEFERKNLVVRAVVRNDSGKGYEVKIDVKNRVRSCSCPAHAQYRDVPCKHVVALARALKDGKV